ncbi:MAG: C45 family autoproteolytic acyltransferase/hydrolase [Candidatus Helarchaeota archaeon]
MKQKQIMSGFFILALAIVSLSGAVWFIDKHNISPRIIDIYGDTFYDMGVRYGAQIKRIISGIDVCVTKLELLIDRLTSLNISEYLQGYLTFIPSYVQDMMHGIADGSGLSYNRIVLLNSMGDLLHHLFLEYMSCSQFAVINNTLPGLGPLFGRNLDYTLNSLFENWQVIVRITPPPGLGKYSMVGIAIAGMVGFENGMNSAGLCIGVTHITSSEIGFGTPYSITMFDTLLKNSNTFEAVKYLTNTTYSSIRHASAWTYLLVDRSGTAAVVEVTNKNNATRWQAAEGHDYIISTNHFVTEEMIPHGVYVAPSSSSKIRMRVLEEILLNKTNFDLKDAVETLRSHYDITIQGDPGEPYSNCIANNDLSGSIHAFIGVPLHNYTLICLTNPAKGPFYLITFNETIGPVA